MPELPEVETVRRTMRPALGARVTSVWTSGLDLHQKRVDRRELSRAARGAVLETVRRWGKFLLLDFEDRSTSIVVHLGMTGRLRIFPRSSPKPAHTHVILRLADGRDIRYSDARRFGQVFSVLRGDERAHPSFTKLGVDPIADSIICREIYERIESSRSPVKTVLLDQTIIAGVGNIYASEALWRSRIAPDARGCDLSRPRTRAMVRAVVKVLEHALEHGGTTLRDFVAADGTAGEHSHYLKVYGREAQRCPRRGCQGQIRRTVIQGRATFYCPSCQRT